MSADQKEIAGIAVIARNRRHRKGKTLKRGGTEVAEEWEKTG
jgi:hypothetical protein